MGFNTSAYNLWTKRIDVVTQCTLEIELLLGTVNDWIVVVPMSLYHVANKTWQKCFKLSPMTSKMPWPKIKDRLALTGLVLQPWKHKWTEITKFSKKVDFFKPIVKQKVKADSRIYN